MEGSYYSVTDSTGVGNLDKILKYIFRLVQLSFNSDEVIVSLSDEVCDLVNIKKMDPNGPSRISIPRDRELN